MSMFLGTHCNRFDAKGRISIPASFRTALKTQAQPGETFLICRPSHLHSCIEGWTARSFSELAAPLAHYDPFSEDHEDLAAALYADAYPLDSDKEGRIILPDILKEHAQLEKEAVFMGLGHIFQIWNPAAALQRRQEARARAKILSTYKSSTSVSRTIDPSTVDNLPSEKGANHV